MLPECGNLPHSSDRISRPDELPRLSTSAYLKRWIPVCFCKTPFCQNRESEKSREVRSFRYVSNYLPLAFAYIWFALNRGALATCSHRIRHNVGRKEQRDWATARETLPLQLRHIYSFYAWFAGLQHHPALHREQKSPGRLLLLWLFLRQPHPWLLPSPIREALFSFLPLLHQSNNYFAKVGIFFGKNSGIQKYSGL